MRYDVVNAQLRTTDCMDMAGCGAFAPQPVAQNIVLMKVQYGIDTNADTFIDTWVSARSAPWTRDAMLGANLAQLKQVKAIRIALVVRSAQFERQRDAEGRTVAADVSSDAVVTLFDCHGMAPCSGEMAAITLPGTVGYRYRTFEQVIPLTNQIWNPS